MNRFDRWGTESIDVWALSPYSTRVHVAQKGSTRTICDLSVAETRNEIAPDYLMCLACIGLRVTVRGVDRLPDAFVVVTGDEAKALISERLYGKRRDDTA